MWDRRGRSLRVDWGARADRGREGMRPPPGLAPLPGWDARVPLHSGLKVLL